MLELFSREVTSTLILGNKAIIRKIKEILKEAAPKIGEQRTKETSVLSVVSLCLFLITNSVYLVLHCVQVATLLEE